MTADRMEYLSEVSTLFNVTYQYPLTALCKDHTKLLLTKEWLVKNDSESSTPYLFVRPTRQVQFLVPCLSDDMSL